MAKRPVRPVVPPVDSDKNLANFTSVLRYNLDELYDVAHNHEIRSAAPTADEGSIGDICPVEAGGVYKLYIKFRGGWKSVTLS